MKVCFVHFPFLSLFLFVSRFGVRTREGCLLIRGNRKSVDGEEKRRKMRREKEGEKEEERSASESGQCALALPHFLLFP